jgi:hypothetical protein
MKPNDKSAEAYLSVTALAIKEKLDIHEDHGCTYAIRQEDLNNSRIGVHDI